MAKLHTYPAKDASKSYPKLKLTYFDGTGRGEPIRIAFFAGGIPFEDERLDFATWGQRKASTKYGQLPVLTIDGKELAQSNAILIYAGEISGLYPTDPVEKAKVNEVLFLIEDIGQGLMKAWQATTDDEKAKAKAEFAEGLKTKGFLWLDRLVKENGNGKYIVGNSLTIADLRIVTQLAWLHDPQGMVRLSTEALDSFPELKKYTENVQDEPVFQGWLAAHNEQNK